MNIFSIKFKYIKKHKLILDTKRKMTLDILYNTTKNAKYPIYDRDELMEILKDVRVKLDDDYFDARDISTMITKYPIKKVSQLIELFIESAHEEYEDKDIARDLKELEE